MTKGHAIDGVLLVEVEARLRPGRFSQVGFLGPNECLAQVIEEDARTLGELGVSPPTLADRLGQLLEAALATKRDVSQVEQFKVRVRRYKGAQMCPFAPQPHVNPCPGGYRRLASIDWYISNSRTRQRLSGPGLIVHLIAEHGFFEGPQSPYRVAPRALAELLELGPFAPSR